MPKRRSILSFLPSRHPRLVTQPPTVHRARPISVSPIESYYASRSTCTEDEESGLDTAVGSYYYHARDSVASRVEVDKRRTRRETKRRTVDTFVPPPPVPRSKHRPPPLDLSKTRAAFPTVKGVTLVKDEVLPRRDQSLPIVRGTKDMEEAKAKAGVMFKQDPFECVTLEPEHRYSWKGEKALEEEVCDKPKPEKKRRVRYIILAIVLLAAIALGVCIPLLTRKKSSPPNQNLQKCLDLYLTTAQSAPSSYPCSECVPLLSGETSSNSTGPLQLCAMMDTWSALGQSQAQGIDKWGKGGNVCEWNGVICDGGQVTSLTLQYPNVPATLPSSLGNIASLATLKLLGNSSAPSGAIPPALLQLNLTTLDIEYTALSSLQIVPNTLKTLILVNNAQLGNLPTLGDKLATLVVTGQGLKSADNLPASLTYLDLSYNAFSGAVPAFSQLTSLQTLYLTNNPFSAPPATLPSSLTTLSLTSNPNLTGAMPASVCTSTTLASCDLRGTVLTGAASDGGLGVGVGVGAKSCGQCKC